MIPPGENLWQADTQMSGEIERLKPRDPDSTSFRTFDVGAEQNSWTRKQTLQ